MREQVILEARSWLGTRFLHQGRVKRQGVDCIGLIVGVANALHIHVQDSTDYSPEPDGYTLQFKLAEQMNEIPISNLQPGDIALFRIAKHPQHVGIIGDYAQGGLSLIHAYQRSGQVVEHRLDNNWQKRIIKAFTFPGI